MSKKNEKKETIRIPIHPSKKGERREHLSKKKMLGVIPEYVGKKR